MYLKLDLYLIQPVNSCRVKTLQGESLTEVHIIRT